MWRCGRGRESIRTGGYDDVPELDSHEVENVTTASQKEEFHEAVV